MKKPFRPVKSALALICAGMLSVNLAQAKLEALNDQELSDVTGQAFINLTTDSANGIDYTRVNFGLKVETVMNMKKLELGRYDRSGELSGTSDILIDNFALGTVNDATGAVNPFLINNPFIELAYSADKVVGVRIGFGESKGTLSGDIQRLTGSVPVQIKGTADPIYNAADLGTRILLGIAGVYRSSTMEAEASLVTTGGNPDPVRGTHSGMQNGQALSCSNGCLGGLTNALLTLFQSTNCEVSGVATCFPLTQFRSLPVGNSAIADNAATRAIEGASKGFFISLQSQNLGWRDLDSGQMITALQGAFLNMSKNRDANGNLVAPININFDQAFNGIPRQDTCFGTLTKGC